jgi:uncharacterized protein YbjT (DUF2867 family)
MITRKPLLAVAAIAVGAALAGCGGSSERSTQPASKLVAVPGNPAGKIVLTAQGAEHIGVQTATVRGVLSPPPAPKAGARAPAPAAPRPPAATAIIPFASVVYAPSGKTYAFTSPAPLTFAEVPITIDHISGNSVYLLRGPRPGATVVTVGAEELFGVQTGVLAQT